MTDPRGGDPIAIVRTMAPRQGIIFRHRELPKRARHALFRHVRRIAQARRQVILLADHPVRAQAWGAAGAHDRSLRRARGLRTVAVHNAREAAAARRLCADLIFVSPVFATRSHPGQAALCRHRLAALTRGQRSVALGGMTAKAMRRLSALGLYGWAGIDAFTPAIRT